MAVSELRHRDALCSDADERLPVAAPQPALRQQVSNKMGNAQCTAHEHHSQPWQVSCRTFHTRKPWLGQWRKMK